MGQLLLSRSAEGVEVDPTWVEPVKQGGDRVRDPRGVPALYHDDHRDAPGAERSLKDSELQTERLQTAVLVRLQRSWTRCGP